MGELRTTLYKSVARFVKKDKTTNQWQLMDEHASHAKISHAIRDYMRWQKKRNGKGSDTDCKIESGKTGMKNRQQVIDAKKDYQQVCDDKKKQQEASAIEDDAWVWSPNEIDNYVANATTIEEDCIVPSTATSSKTEEEDDLIFSLRSLCLMQDERFLDLTNEEGFQNFQF